MGAGLGFGGSCFPKDVQALIKIADRCDVMPAILNAVLDVNRQQVQRVCNSIEQHLHSLKGRRIGLLGLAFEPNTDDVRESPAIALAEALLSRGVQITAHDPVAAETAKRVLGERLAYVERSYEATKNADAVVIATDWNQYKNIDLEIVGKLMRGSLFIDARNIHDPLKVGAAGLKYVGIGRGASLNGKSACAS